MTKRFLMPFLLFAAMLVAVQATCVMGDGTASDEESLVSFDVNNAHGILASGSCDDGLALTPAAAFALPLILVSNGKLSAYSASFFLPTVLLGASSPRAPPVSLA